MQSRGVDARDRERARLIRHITEQARLLGASRDFARWLAFEGRLQKTALGVLRAIVDFDLVCATAREMGLL
jgi:hypothetical protein